MQLKKCRIILMVYLILISSSPLPLLAQSVKKNHQTHDADLGGSDILLNNMEQTKLGAYIRSCEVDRMQSSHYETEYDKCNRELGSKPNIPSKILSYLMVLTIGYAIGVSK